MPACAPCPSRFRVTETVCLLEDWTQHKGPRDGTYYIKDGNPESKTYRKPGERGQSDSDSPAGATAPGVPAQDRKPTTSPAPSNDAGIPDSIFRQPGAPISPQATRRIAYEVEDVIRERKDIEVCSAIGADGRKILTKSGGRDSVTFTNDELEAMTGAAVFTHNHPDGWLYKENDPQRKGGGFSDPDVMTAVRCQFGEMRVVSPGYRYSLKIPVDFVDRQYESFERIVNKGSRRTPDEDAMFQAFKRRYLQAKNGAILREDFVARTIVYSEFRAADEAVQAVSKSKIDQILDTNGFDAAIPVAQLAEASRSHEIMLRVAKRFGWNYTREEYQSWQQPSTKSTTESLCSTATSQPPTWWTSGQIPTAAEDWTKIRGKRGSQNLWQDETGRQVYSRTEPGRREAADAGGKTDAKRPFDAGPTPGHKPPATETPEFSRWFGDSKAVDGSGKPLVVYHGTRDAIDQFDPEIGKTIGGFGGEGVFFVSEPEVAANYAYGKSLAVKRAEVEAQNAQDALDAFVADVAARVGVSAPESDNGRLRMFNELLGEGRISPAEYDQWSRLDDARYDAENREVSDEAAEGAPNIVPAYLSLRNPKIVDCNGLPGITVIPHHMSTVDRTVYDGIIFRNVRDNGMVPGRNGEEAEMHADVYVAFRPEQIKSATGNRGTFDPQSPKINESRTVREEVAFEGWVPYEGKRGGKGWQWNGRGRPRYQEEKPREPGDGSPESGVSLRSETPAGSETGGMSQQVRRSLGGYKNAGHASINRLLRHPEDPLAARPGTPEYDKIQWIVRDLDAAVASSRLDEPKVFYRGVGYDLEADRPGVPADIKPGDTFSDAGFASTSTDQRVAKKWLDGADNTLLVIQAPAGTPALAMDQFTENQEREYEWLLPRGMTYRVLGVSTIQTEHGPRRRVDAVAVPANTGTSRESRPRFRQVTLFEACGWDGAALLESDLDGGQRRDGVLEEWTPYHGPLGGTGWQWNGQGEPVYQDEMPGEPREPGGKSQRDLFDRDPQVSPPRPEVRPSPAAPSAPPIRQPEPDKSDLGGGTIATDRGEREARYRDMRRSRKNPLVEFPKPIVGPSGAKLLSYEWKYTMYEDVDARGEERIRRVSDWDEAVGSDDTGRSIVHQFHLSSPDGKPQIVSLESALKELGYLKRDAKSLGVTNIKTLASALKRRALSQVTVDQRESLQERFDAAMKETRQRVDGLSLPDITEEAGDEGLRKFRMGDAQQWKHGGQDLTPDERKSLEREWRRNRLVEHFPLELAQEAAGLDGRAGTEEAARSMIRYNQDLSSFRQETDKMKKKIGDLDRQITILADEAAETAAGGVSGPEKHRGALRQLDEVWATLQMGADGRKYADPVDAAKTHLKANGTENWNDRGRENGAHEMQEIVDDLKYLTGRAYDGRKTGKALYADEIPKRQVYGSWENAVPASPDKKVTKWYMENKEAIEDVLQRLEKWKRQYRPERAAESQVREGWITLNAGSGDDEEGGVRVYIDDGSGKVTAGPEGLMGKAFPDARGKSRPVAQLREPGETRGGAKPDDTQAGPAKPAEPKVETPAQPPAEIGRSPGMPILRFPKPIVGPSGARLESYEWKYTTEEDEQAGKRRVSDWAQAVGSDRTGRDIVHQFHVVDRDGNRKVVSLDSALKELGYVPADAKTAPVKGIKDLGTALKRRGLAQLEIDRREDLQRRFDATLEKINREVAALPIPAAQKIEDQDGYSRHRIGDVEQRQAQTGGLTGDVQRELEQEWRKRRAAERFPLDLGREAAVAVGLPGNDTEAWAMATRGLRYFKDDTAKKRQQLRRLDQKIEELAGHASRVAESALCRQVTLFEAWSQHQGPRGGTYWLQDGDPATKTYRRPGEQETGRKPDMGKRDGGGAQPDLATSRTPAIETPEFKQWFGDSEVVDSETGEPLVVYHGTDADFADFDNAKAGNRKSDSPGYFFTADKGIAAGYGRNVKPVYLKSENLLVIDFAGNSRVSFLGRNNLSPSELAAVVAELKSDIDNQYEIDDATKDELEQHNINLLANQTIDGIKLLNVNDSMELIGGKTATHFVVFDPSQIRSAKRVSGLTESNASWIAYHGPRGGTGWENTDTGYVAYVKDRPGSRDDSRLATTKADQPTSYPVETRGRQYVVRPEAQQRDPHGRLSGDFTQRELAAHVIDREMGGRLIPVTEFITTEGGQAIRQPQVAGESPAALTDLPAGTQQALAAFDFIIGAANRRPDQVKLDPDGRPQLVGNGRAFYSNGDLAQIGFGDAAQRPAELGGEGLAVAEMVLSYEQQLRPQLMMLLPEPQVSDLFTRAKMLIRNQRNLRELFSADGFASALEIQEVGFPTVSPTPLGDDPETWGETPADREIPEAMHDRAFVGADRYEEYAIRFNQALRRELGQEPARDDPLGAERDMTPHWPAKIRQDVTQRIPDPEGALDQKADRLLTALGERADGLGGKTALEKITGAVISAINEPARANRDWAQAIQYAAAERFGGRVPAWADRTLYDQDPELFHAIAQGIYDNTQNRLRAARIPGLVVYRGLDLTPQPEEFRRLWDTAATGRGAVRAVDDVQVNQQPVASWTQNPYLAHNAAVGHGSNRQMLIGAWVPAEKIFSLPFSGPGDPKSQEVLTLGEYKPERTRAVLFNDWRYSLEGKHVMGPLSAVGSHSHEWFWGEEQALTENPNDTTAPREQRKDEEVAFMYAAGDEPEPGLKVLRPHSVEQDGDQRVESYLAMDQRGGSEARTILLQVRAKPYRAAEAWTPYRGPLGGKGWQDTTTGEVEYGTEQPGRETLGSARGQEASRRADRTGSPGDAPAYRASAVETPEFKAWFRDSQVVDQDGQPLVVYHGTSVDDDFTAFRPEGYNQWTKAVWFSAKPDMAEIHANRRRQAMDIRGEQGESPARIFPVFLAMQNPMIIDMSGSSEPPDHEVIADARDEGHDGVIFKNAIDGKADRQDVFAVFDADQIKSPYNRGTWERGNPNISESGQGRRPVVREILLDRDPAIAGWLHRYRVFQASEGWVQYDGPRGGEGWENTETGKVRYVEERPGEGDAATAEPQEPTSLKPHVADTAQATADKPPPPEAPKPTPIRFKVRGSGEWEWDGEAPVVKGPLGGTPHYRVTRLEDGRQGTLTSYGREGWRIDLDGDSSYRPAARGGGRNPIEAKQKAERQTETRSREGDREAGESGRKAALQMMDAALSDLRPLRQPAEAMANDVAPKREETTRIARESWTKVVNRFGPKALEAIGQVKKITVYEDQKQLIQGLVTPGRPEEDVRGVQGAYRHDDKTGELLLSGAGVVDPEGVYAHELTHAVDGPQSVYSSARKWRNAWKAEIGSKEENRVGRVRLPGGEIKELVGKSAEEVKAGDKLLLGDGVTKEVLSAEIATVGRLGKVLLVRTADAPEDVKQLNPKATFYDVNSPEAPPAPLTRYAQTSASEGLAEFGRLLVADPARAKKEFPKCWKCWREWHLVEEPTAGESVTIGRLREYVAFEVWDESKYERDKEGQFAKKGMGGGDSANIVGEPANNQQEDRSMNDYEGIVGQSGNAEFAKAYLAGLPADERQSLDLFIDSLKAKGTNWERKIGSRLAKGEAWLKENGLVPKTFDQESKRLSDRAAASQADADRKRAEFQAARPADPEDIRVKVVDDNGVWRYKLSGMHAPLWLERKRFDSPEEAAKELDDHLAKEKAKADQQAREREERRIKQEREESERVAAVAEKRAKGIDGQWARAGQAIQISVDEKKALGGDELIGVPVKFGDDTVEVTGFGRPFQKGRTTYVYAYVKRPEIDDAYLEQQGRQRTGAEFRYEVSGQPFNVGDVVLDDRERLGIVAGVESSRHWSLDNIDDEDEFGRSPGRYTVYRVVPVSRKDGDPETKAMRQDRQKAEFTDWLATGEAKEVYDELPSLYRGGDDDRFTHIPPQPVAGRPGIFSHRGPYPLGTEYFRQRPDGKYEALGEFKPSDRRTTK